MGVQLCPSALDGESANLVLLRRLRLASAPPCRFRARFAGRRSQWGMPATRSSRSLLVRWRCHGSSVTAWGPLLVPGSFDSLATGILSFEVVVEWFSSSHWWSLLHWRHLSVFWPTSVVDCYLSSLRAGDCGLPLWRRIPTRVLMIACLPLLRVWRTAPSHVPLMPCASTGFFFSQSWPLLVFPLCGFSAGLCRSSLASPCRSPLRFCTCRFLLTVVLSS